MGERRGALDGIRALALVAVLLYHSLPGAVPGGFLGVEVFFVLSGYLLTSILLREHATRGSVGWVSYYTRRVRRLGPALLAVLGALVLLAPLFAHDDAHRLAGDVYSSLAGVANWHLIRDHSSYFGGLGRPPLIRHVWSLSVEMQFYAVCPLLASWLARRRRTRTAVAALGAGMGASALTMAFLYNAADPSRAYYGTDARVGALLAGTLLAVLVARVSLDAVAARLPRGAGVLALLTLTALSLWSHERSHWMYPLGFLVTQAATAVLIVRGLQHGVLARALALRPLRWLGERSYGVYLWHWPLVALLRPRVDVTWSPTTAAAVTIAAALVLGHLSFAFVETPFLHRAPRRDRVLSSVQWALALVATTGVAMLVADLPHTDPLVSSLRAGQQVVSLQTAATTTTEAPTTTTTVAAPAPEPPTTVAVPVTAAKPVPPPLPAGPAPGSVAVSAIGDSVMLGAAPQLQQRLGGSGYIDAKVGRQYVQGVDVARQLREQGRLGAVAVIHLGTNGPPRDRDVDAMMAQLAAVPKVVFVTVRMPRDWEAVTNQTLQAAAARYPKIALVDWHGYSDGHPDWFLSDGIHLKPSGALAYAQLVGSAL